MDEEMELMSLEEIDGWASVLRSHLTSASYVSIESLQRTARAAHKLKQRVEELERKVRWLDHEADGYYREARDG
jgi:hypothetical protein